MSQNIKREVAEALLDHEAVIIRNEDWFTWASGIKSPIYCDNRQLMSYPKARKLVAQALANLIKEKYPNVTCIAGTATAGIPHAAWVSEILDLPMVYVRSKAKDHGRQSQIEGHLKADDQVVLIDDLISTGGSVLEACQPVTKECSVIGVAAIFTYELDRAKKNFQAADIPLAVLSDFHSLLEVAKEKHDFSQADMDNILDWHRQLNQSSNE
ncbi:orotate phosphoribosyltransferase [Aerococcus urinae]|uniref:orotate phosphoribosyltransferase n=1 Tax=Aerococcus mictus TaxID=2976810 RepID=UPI0012446FF5|nr:orotate phosphoribosyltransferase [Aerococcus mictus]KAA9232396.1 orotate phosphoribosyltransferase [Aerococcus mictus]